LDWLKEIEFTDLLDGDAALIAQECGVDTLIKLWESFSGMMLYISQKPINKAKKRYIMKFYNGRNVHSLAVKLKISERFIFNTLKAKKMPDGKTP